MGLLKDRSGSDLRVRDVMQTPSLLQSGRSGPRMLDAHIVAEEAEATIRALRIAKDAQFESLYSYLIVDEPSVQLLPLHFLPPGSEDVVGKDTLHDLGVAAKLEYARNRWLDDLVDAKDHPSLPLAAHRINDLVIALIKDRYRKVLDVSVAASFYDILADLYARHSLSLVIDGWRAGYPECAMSLKEYVEHARARHGPMRAPLDAILLLTNAPDRTLRKARVSWHNWELGVQFYDDALDVEEDFRNGNPSWVVSRTLEIFHGELDPEGTSAPPGSDEFYRIALTEGTVCQALTYAASFFAASASQAAQNFPTWAAFQSQCLCRTVSLREDYEKMIAEAREA
ncbi:MAG TPA: hypothetical protein VFI90_12835 [Rubrobacter sp.]|nr:hypothetical protein [Rubrobacter sp.]